MPQAKDPPPNAGEKLPARQPLLRRLGLFGLDAIEPILLAALVTEEPLLLVGPHGTGKSLLLTRVAEALGLGSRHYNASLLNFDDLLGFPLPREDGQLQYVQTPASIWGVEAVIFDEINRCRPDMANRLFPIIHEKRAQGIRLDDLRYRWAAMNPPRNDERDDADDDDPYVGTRPLDAALADRFAFIVTMPGWKDYSEADRLAIVAVEEEPAPPDAAEALREEVVTLRRRYRDIRRRWDPVASSYVSVLVSLLGRRGTLISPRRSGMLRRSIFAVASADSRRDPNRRFERSAFEAVRNGLPQTALGVPVPGRVLRLAHREAWACARERTSPRRRRILISPDPLDRVILAIAEPELARAEFTAVIAEAMTEASPGAREAIAVHLFESGAAARLHASVASEAATRCRQAVVLPRNGLEMEYSAWRQAQGPLARLDPRDPRARLAANALAWRCVRRNPDLGGNAETFLAEWMATDRALRAARTSD